jgi:hypothetical protein
VIRIKAFQEREDLRFPPDRAGHEKSPVVGPAVDLRIQHPKYRGHIVHGHAVTEFEDAGDPAHGGAATSARRAARMKEGALLCGDASRIEGAIPLDRWLRYVISRSNAARLRPGGGERDEQDVGGGR